MTTEQFIEIDDYAKTYTYRLDAQQYKHIFQNISCFMSHYLIYSEAGPRISPFTFSSLDEPNRAKLRDIVRKHDVTERAFRSLTKKRLHALMYVRLLNFYQWYPCALTRSQEETGTLPNITNISTAAEQALRLFYDTYEERFIMSLLCSFIIERNSQERIRQITANN